MSELTLISDFSLDTTSLSNVYIDEYMSSNNESQIKIYLYLLRNLSKGASVSSISIADTFNYSVMDVERALMYMEKQGLMSLKMEGGSIVGLKLLPLKKKRNDAVLEGFKLMDASENQKNENNVSDDQKHELKEIIKPEYSAKEVAEFCEDSEVEELTFAVQQIMGKPLKPADLKSILFINRELGLSLDLIDYLVEYCVERGKKSFHYMEEVARDWYEKGIKTVKDAKNITTEIPVNVYEVFKAFSMKAGSRKPSASEIRFVNRWTKEYAFTMDIIRRACEITVDRIHTVSFEYADAILSDWSRKGVKHLSDIDKLNTDGKKSESESVISPQSGARRKQKPSGFSGRNIDFEQLEKELLRK